MRLILAIADWFEQRLGARAALEPMIAHPVPRTTASWWYVFGSATLALFVLQIVTGICLALVYVPTADQAFQTLEYLNYQTPFGWYLRAVHFWGSNGMVLMGLVALHLWLVLRLGINEWPMPGRLVDRTTYRQRYEAEVQRDGVPFFPVAAQKDMVGMAIVTMGVLVCAALFGPSL
jgi:quinol-cytochrome oxidoreductase complex cytochrome b subunit